MSKNSKLITFTPARLAEGKETFVVFYVMNHLTEKLVRRKIKLNHIKDLKERKRFAEALIKEVNKKLYAGWNPLMEDTAARGTTVLQNACEIFWKAKHKELRDDSLRSYRSFLDAFQKWLKLQANPNMMTAYFSRINAIEYLEYIGTKDVSNTTLNNYKNFMNVFFNWLLENSYVAENHFMKIKNKVQKSKDRILIDPSTRTLILNYLEEKDYNFLIVSLLVFHALIRPNDIANLKPRHFRLKDQMIDIDAATTKNKRHRSVTIPDSLMRYLVQWNFNNAENNEYIFGYNYTPGDVPIDPRRFSKKWSDMRIKLKLSPKQKLYSLRDSGIVQMFSDGISLPEVMKQAGHNDSSVTMIYALHASQKSSDEIRMQNSKF